MALSAYRLAFDGAILERGFWIYAWKIVHGKELAVYVGRTGDSSSPNASSPFRRAGQHLDIKPDAKGNSLKRAIDNLGWAPESCRFEQIALGPFFPEQESMAAHIPYRDRIAAIEHEISKVVGNRYCLIGNHGSSFEVAEEDQERLGNAVRQIIDFLESPQ